MRSPGGSSPPPAASLDDRLALRIAAMRVDRGWSLDDLARRTGVSRSTLSRLERAEISPTAALLGKLCAAYGTPLSRLIAEVESDAAAAELLRADDQPVWRDKTTGFVRRSVSPPHPGLRADLIEGVLRPGADIVYDGPPVAGLEHHVWVLEGSVEITLDGSSYTLNAGDCLRFRLWGTSEYRCPGPDPVRYLIAGVMP